MPEIENQTVTPSAWCLVANVTRARHVEGRGGNEIEADQVGTKHFRPGAKLYLIRYFQGEGFDRFEVIGHHRKSGRRIRVVVNSRHMENFRARQVFDPVVVEATGTFWTGDRAKEAAAYFDGE